MRRDDELPMPSDEVLQLAERLKTAAKNLKDERPAIVGVPVQFFSDVIALARSLAILDKSLKTYQSQIRHSPPQSPADGPV